MKWQFIIFLNVLIVFGFWLVGIVTISPAYNHFILYPEISDTEAMPVLTSFIFSVRFISLLIPFLWLVISIGWIKKLKKLSQPERVEWVQLHTSVSVLGGLMLFIAFTLAGILPFLRFGVVLE